MVVGISDNALGSLLILVNSNKIGSQYENGIETGKG
jgi:hypothetical protein